MVARPDPLGGQMVGQLVGPCLHLGVRPSLAVGDEVLPLGVGVDGRLEQVGEVELHRAEIRTRSCSAGNRPHPGDLPGRPASWMGGPARPEWAARLPPLIPTIGLTSLMDPVEPKKVGPPEVGKVKTPPSDPLRK